MYIRLRQLVFCVKLKIPNLRPVDDISEQRALERRQPRSRPAYRGVVSSKIDPGKCH